jgi:hypothetical protein
MHTSRIKLAAETDETLTLLLIFRPDTSHACLIIAGLTSGSMKASLTSTVKNYAETFTEASSHISKIIYH